MMKDSVRLCTLGLVLWSLLGVPVWAQTGHHFRRIATFTVRQNSPDAKETVAEILSANSSGTLVVYTDAESNQLGLVDLTDPGRPRPAGVIPLGGSPTSVAVRGDLALVVVESSPGDGFLNVIDLPTRQSVARLELGGQPDSIALSKDGRFAVIAIENESSTGSAQQPPGWVTIVGLEGEPRNWSVRRVDVRGLASVRPDDPEPEFVDINSENIAVVSLQENNHLLTIDLERGRILNSFSAGMVDLQAVDLVKDFRITSSDYRTDVPREPDSVTWTSRGFATADEGDLLGGSRSFTLFDSQGNVTYASANMLDRIAAKMGHYPDFRSDERGIEPEGLEVGIFGGRELLFVGLERASLVTVFDLTSGHPEFLQALPAGVGPEGLLALPDRGLFLVAAEVDRPERGVHSAISVYRWQKGPATYPHLISNGMGWGGLSGLTADLDNPSFLYTIQDKQVRPASILKIATTEQPARIVAEILVTDQDRNVSNYDLEGVARSRQGGFWLVSEGSPNLLLKVDDSGRVEQEITLPVSVQAHRISQGFEGVAEVDGMVYVAFQRPWKDDPRDRLRLGRYNPQTKEWSFAHYPMDNEGTGLSGLSPWGPGQLAVLERDNKSGPDARLKRVYTVELKDFESGLLSKTLLRDLMSPLQALNGQIPEKIEGIARDAAGSLWVINDNDGTNFTNGETILLRL